MTRRVIVTKQVRVPAEVVGTWKMEKQEFEANFHQFGASYEEYEAGPANYSIAIIEKDDGQVEEVPASFIKFCDPIGGVK